MTDRRRFLLISTGAAAFLAAPAIAKQGWEVPQAFKPRLVALPDPLPSGEIHVEPDEFALYLTIEGRIAKRYTVAIGRDGLYESGVFQLGAKRKWPWWRPTPQMIRRDPGTYAKYRNGVPGGPKNPLGARALYLHDLDGRDSMLRIHGTTQPWTIGTAASSGCARMVNEHVEDLYDRVALGARVVLHEKGRREAGLLQNLAVLPPSRTE